jgi:hypothetical protein
MTNAHAFILGVLASWAPSVALFACLVYFRGTREAVPGQEAVDTDEHRDRRKQAAFLHDEENVCVPFSARWNSKSRSDKRLRARSE